LFLVNELGVNHNILTYCAGWRRTGVVPRHRQWDVSWF